MKTMIIAAALALLLSACGGESDEQPTTEQPQAAEPEEIAMPETTPFDRILIKPNEGVDVDAHLLTVIEIAAGAPVAAIRPLPLGWYSLRFRAAAPGRDEAAQAELVAAIERLASIQFAEADKVATVRGGA